jgi:hypothetical protein
MEHTKDIGKYGQPKTVPVPSCCGYPNKIANTQTVKVRGAGAAAKGTRASTKMG